MIMIMRPKLHIYIDKLHTAEHIVLGCNKCWLPLKLVSVKRVRGTLYDQLFIDCSLYLAIFSGRHGGQLSGYLRRAELRLTRLYLIKCHCTDKNSEWASVSTIKKITCSQIRGPLHKCASEDVT